MAAYNDTAAGTNLSTNSSTANTATSVAARSLFPPASRGVRLGGSPRTASPSAGSQTLTVNDAHDSRSVSPDPLVLRLRGERTPETTTTATVEEENGRNRRRIQWAEDVIDNEGLGRKRSKVCCIFHKTREVGESSSEDDSSSSSDSDGSNGSSGSGGEARPVGGYRRGRRKGKGGRRNHDHHDHDHDHDHEHGHRRPSPNAYERMPRYDIKPLAQQPSVGQSGTKS